MVLLVGSYSDLIYIHHLLLGIYASSFFIFYPRLMFMGGLTLISSLKSNLCVDIKHRTQ